MTWESRTVEHPNHRVPVLEQRRNDAEHHHRSVDDLAGVAALSMRAGAKAHRAGDVTTASAAFRRCREVASLLAVRDPHRAEASRLEADALYHLCGIQLDLGHCEEARVGLDAAEALYSQLGDLGRVADVRARRARAHAEAGLGLSALVDAQSAVLHHVQNLDPEGPDDAQLGLAQALSCAAVAQAGHGGSRLALTAAQQASALLTRLADADRDGAAHRDPGDETPADGARRPDGSPQVRADLVRSLQVEIRMLRALGRTAELGAPMEALAALEGGEQAGELLEGAPEPLRADLAYAVRHELVMPEIRQAVTAMLARPIDAVSVPGFLVEPGHLLDAAREGASTALALAGRDPRLALAAGRDAACLYACAEELGLVEHPWPQVRIELARWLWLLSELAWLACTVGDVVLARDLAHHAEHPLIRAESGRHLPSAIARSLAESNARLQQLRRAIR